MYSTKILLSGYQVLVPVQMPNMYRGGKDVAGAFTSGQMQKFPYRRLQSTTLLPSSQSQILCLSNPSELRVHKHY
jgi:hypothetical protein